MLSASAGGALMTGYSNLYAPSQPPLMGDVVLNRRPEWREMQTSGTQNLRMGGLGSHFNPFRLAYKPTWAVPVKRGPFSHQQSFARFELWIDRWVHAADAVSLVKLEVKMAQREIEWLDLLASSIASMGTKLSVYAVSHLRVRINSQAA